MKSALSNFEGPSIFKGTLEQGYSQEAIAMQLSVDQATVSRDLSTLCIVHNVEARGKDTLGRKKSTGRRKGKRERINETPSAAVAARLILDEGKSYGDVEKETGLSNTV